MSQPVQVCLDSRERVFALTTAMAGMVENAVSEAIEALLAGDMQLAQSVLQRESVINQMEMHVDAAILFCLGQRDLSTQDIRSMGSILKINKDLERMGDLAANIARRVSEVAAHSTSERFELQPMAIAVSHMCRKTLRALVRQDVVLAESALGTETLVQAYRNYVSSRIRERLGRGVYDAVADVALLLASRSLEQIANHAANLADTLFFWMRSQPERERVA
ncbi:MAG TPA: PhoU domain-containing protein [Candidatus Angelobacter sp.]